MTEEGKKGKKLKFKKIIVGALILIFASATPMMVRLWQHKRSVETVFGDFTESLLKNQYEAAYRIAGADFVSGTSYEQFASFQQRIRSEYGELRSVRQDGIEVHGRGYPIRWVARVEVDMDYSKEKTRWIFEFHLERGTWKLFGYKQL